MILFASDRDGSFEMQKDSKGRIRISYDLYRSVKQSDGSWGKPEKIPGNVNSRKHERFPSLSPDRKTIFYSSWDFGHLDSIQLMRADVTPRGYSEARPLSQINQSAREIQFVYDPSQSGFHFASAREGYGGWDLFFVPFSAGQFGAVINMGANYNTEFHDMSMAVAGSQMMISSNRPGGVGGYDLYFSEGSEKSSRIFAFRITDEKSKNSLGGKVKIFIKKADIPLPDARGALIEKSVKEDGKLDVKISEKVEQIQVVVETEGYLPYSQVFNTIQMPTTQIDLPMIPLKKDAKLVVHDIHFDYDSAILKDESRQILDSLIRFLNQYPKVKLLITGHTDLHGEAKYNQILSEERASAVRDHLVDAGIEKQRFRLQGAGKSMPLKNGLGPGFDEINRRTEFEIIQLK
jgi:outer membrane protein OmpA-like peptidoglycan-associated protein